MKIKNRKRFISLVLILALSIGFIAGCKTGTEENKANENTAAPSAGAGETDALPAGDAEAKPSHYEASYLPEADYGGYEFRAITPPNGYYNILSLEMVVEEETGDILYDAIYKRNKIIEEKYNIVIKNTVVNTYDETLSAFQKSSQSGSYDFDLCMLLPQHAWPQALKGNIMPVSELPYLDITQPWYVHDVNKGFSIGGKNFYVYSDECLNLFELSYCILFNKKIAGDLGLDNMYNLVKDNKWTMDTFFGYAKMAKLDLNGDGAMTDADRYGISGISTTVYPPLWNGAGVTLVGKDSEDYHVFSGDNQRVYDVMDKIYKNLRSDDRIYFDGMFDKSAQFGNDPLQVAIKQFANNYGLFYADAISVVPLLRSMETDFGILPLPKYDEAQEKYYTSSGKGWINCVSVSNTNPERTSAIMESLAIESKNYTIPAYIEVALRTKYSRDDESLEMLDIIEKSRMVDLGFSVYWQIIGDKYTYAFINKNNNFASLVEKNIGSINKAIDESNEMARGLK